MLPKDSHKDGLSFCQTDPPKQIKHIGELLCSYSQNYGKYSKHGKTT